MENNLVIQAQTYEEQRLEFLKDRKAECDRMLAYYETSSRMKEKYSDAKLHELKSEAAMKSAFYDDAIEALNEKRKYFSVTVTSAWDNAMDYEPRTAVFSSRDAAEGFKCDLEALFEKYEMTGDYLVTIDAGGIDSESYLEVYEIEFEGSKCEDSELEIE